MLLSMEELIGIMTQLLTIKLFVTKILMWIVIILVGLFALAVVLSLIAKISLWISDGIDWVKEKYKQNKLNK